MWASAGAFDVLGVKPALGRLFQPSDDARGSESRLDRRTSWWLQVFVRLKRGQAREAAATLIQTLQHGIREATLPPSSPGRNDDRYLADPFTFVDAARGLSGLRDYYSRPLLVLMVVVGLVLLIGG